MESPVLHKRGAFLFRLSGRERSQGQCHTTMRRVEDQVGISRPQFAACIREAIFVPWNTSGNKRREPPRLHSGPGVGELAERPVPLKAGRGLVPTQSGRTIAPVLPQRGPPKESFGPFGKTGARRKCGNGVCLHPEEPEGRQAVLREHWKSGISAEGT